MALLLLAAAPAHAVSFALTYDASVNPSTEKPIFDHAAALWEGVFTGPEPVSVTIQKAPLSGGLLGLASGYTSTLGPGGPSGLLQGQPTGGTITFDSGTMFFLDGTPDLDAEYRNVVATPSNPVPGTYLETDPTIVANPAVGKTDLLTVALHEFGHILGFSSSFQGFVNGVKAQGTVSNQLIYVFGGTPKRGSPSDYLAGVRFTHGGAFLPPKQGVGEEDPEDAGSMGGIPSHLDDVDRSGTDAGLFRWDVLNASIFSDERIHIANVDIDILADSYGYTVAAPEPAASLLLPLGLLGLVWRRLRQH